MWDKYSLAGRIKGVKSASIGVSCFFVGKIWDMAATGESRIIDTNKNTSIKAALGRREILIQRTHIKEL